MGTRTEGAKPAFYSGNIHVTPINSAGVATGVTVGPLRASLFTFQPVTALIELQSTEHDTHGEGFGGYALPSPPVVGINFWDSPDLIQGAALLGEVTTVSFVAATATAQALTLAANGWGDLGHKNLDVGSVVITNVGATVTYNLDTDYDINHRLGWILPLPGGLLAAGGDIEYTWTSAAHDATQIESGKKSDFRVRINFDGQEKISLEYFDVTMPLVTLGSNVPLDHVALTHVDWQFVGSAASLGTQAALTKLTKVV